MAVVGTLHETFIGRGCCTMSCSHICSYNRHQRAGWWWEPSMWPFQLSSLHIQLLATFVIATATRGQVGGGNAPLNFHHIMLYCYPHLFTPQSMLYCYPLVCTPQRMLYCYPHLFTPEYAIRLPTLFTPPEYAILLPIFIHSTEYAILPPTFIHSTRV